MERVEKVDELVKEVRGERRNRAGRGGEDSMWCWEKRRDQFAVKKRI